MEAGRADNADTRHEKGTNCTLTDPDPPGHYILIENFHSYPEGIVEIKNTFYARCLSPGISNSHVYSPMVSIMGYGAEVSIPRDVLKIANPALYNRVLERGSNKFQVVQGSCDPIGFHHVLTLVANGRVLVSESHLRQFFHAWHALCFVSGNVIPNGMVEIFFKEAADGRMVQVFSQNSAGLSPQIARIMSVAQVQFAGGFGQPTRLLDVNGDADPSMNRGRLSAGTEGPPAGLLASSHQGMSGLEINRSADESTLEVPSAEAPQLALGSSQVTIGVVRQQAPGQLMGSAAACVPAVSLQDAESQQGAVRDVSQQMPCPQPPPFDEGISRTGDAAPPAIGSDGPLASAAAGVRIKDKKIHVEALQTSRSPSAAVLAEAPVGNSGGRLNKASHSSGKTASDSVKQLKPLSPAVKMKQGPLDSEGKKRKKQLHETEREGDESLCGWVPSRPLRYPDGIIHHMDVKRIEEWVWSAYFPADQEGGGTKLCYFCDHCRLVSTTLAEAQEHAGKQPDMLLKLADPCSDLAIVFSADGVRNPRAE